MSRIDVYISEDLKKMIEDRAQDLNVKVSEYLRMLSICDISKQKLKVLHYHEVELINNINEIEDTLKKSEV